MATVSQAAAIYPDFDGVSTNIGECCGAPITNLIDGSGLSSRDPGATHAPVGVWIGTSKTGTITFDLSGEFVLTGATLWNTAFGVSSFRLDASVDGVNYQPMLGTTALANVASGSTTTAETFTFLPVTASYVKMTLLDSHSISNSTGLKEVLFISNVPEPGTVGLNLAALTALGFRRRRAAAR